jgi:uncharacterized membrane protein YqgA involved in biofilm formation
MRKPLTVAQESYLKLGLGVFTVYYGLRLTILNLNGPFVRGMKELVILLLALVVGRLLGRLFRIQEASNEIGRIAREKIAAASGGQQGPPDDGFKICAALFCVAPLGIVGSAEDGLAEYYYPLVVKAVMDGLAAMAMVRLFGWSVLFSAVPVVAVQGTIGLLCAARLRPFLEAHAILEPVNALAGIVVFAIALVVLQIKKIPLSDYLPGLVVAPLLAWFWGW